MNINPETRIKSIVIIRYLNRMTFYIARLLQLIGYHIIFIEPMGEYRSIDEIKKLTKLYTGLLFVTSIVGCNSASSINETVLATHYDKNTVSYQKQGAAVSLVNRQVNLDAAGVKYEVDLAINSKYSSGNMTVSIKSSEGLYIVGSQTDVEETLIKGSISSPLTVT